MENLEIQSPSEDVVLIPFVKSLKKLLCIENNEARTDPNPAGQRIHIIQSVPDVLRAQNEYAYTPTTVSIGPLHKRTLGVEAMEPIKLSYTRALLGRTCTTVAETMKDCAAAMLKVEEDVRKCYEPSRLQLLQPSNTQENISWLAELMLIDGCFIVEFLLKDFKGENDPNLFNPFKCYAIQRDLLLVENQIPFKVLEELFNLTVEKIPKQSHQQCSLPELILSFFGDIMGPMGGHRNASPESSSINHILHFFHIYYVPSHIVEPSPFGEENQNNCTARELRLAGVELKAGKDRNLFDIQFNTSFSCTSCFSLFRKGHFEIPPFSVHEDTESFFRNLIAFELSCPWVGYYFTSLAFLMDLLIDTPKDVKLFEEAGIIWNDLVSREEVARLFNGICKNAYTLDFIYGKQYLDAMNFCTPRRVSNGRIKHYYFGNPWSGISIIAALILFVLTLLQTIYTLLSYP